ncbi:MAG: ABC transporter permease subunit [Firmicutes bacterium]|nr:ABC transporter permease subunit [Bacillota bacterium]
MYPRTNTRLVKSGVSLFKDKNTVLYIMLIPGIIYYIAFHYMPMYGLLMAFKDFNIFLGFGESPWVGLENFKILLGMDDIYRVVYNTLKLNLLNLFCGFPMPIILALMINEVKNRHFNKISQSLLYLPHFFSWVIAGSIISAVLSTSTGMVNNIIKFLGHEPIYFLGDEGWWVFTYVISGIWKDMGWNSIIYVAAISNIDPQLYDAAKVDGANRIHSLFNVTLPSIAGTICTMLILQLGKLLTIGFEHPYVLQNPMVYKVSEVISTYIYKIGIEKAQYSLTTAMGLFQSVVGLIMIFLANALIKKMGEEGIL